MSAAAQTTNSNAGDKITLALIGQKLDALADGQREVLDTLKTQAKELHRLDTEQCLQAQDIDSIEKDIANNIKPAIKSNHDDLDDVRIKSNWWNGINTFAVTIATILGIRN